MGLREDSANASLNIGRRQFSREVQTHFVTMVGPAHYGDQKYRHQDFQYHLAFPDETLIKPPFAGDHHRPLPFNGQTKISDFILQKLPGIR